MMGNLQSKAELNQKLTFTLRESNKSRFAGKLLYWWSMFVASLLLLVVGTPVILILFLINKRTWIYPLALWGAETWLSASRAKVKVTGTENVVLGQSYVFASNHRSYLDTAALFRYAGRRIGLVAKRELLKVPVLGQGMGFANIIAIDRSDPQRALQSMEKARDVMKKGYSFGVFVEGTRAMPGELLPFKKGAFHLAVQTGSPIIPVAIKNTDWMMGKHTGVAYPGTIEMVLLPAIETTGEEGTTDVIELLQKTRALIAVELAK
jgi:1-acyl-sn-glycerol-3-phosphate acyltransferase